MVFWKQPSNSKLNMVCNKKIINFFLRSTTNQVWISLELNASPIPVQIVEFRGAPSSYAVSEKLDEPAWWKF